MSLLNAFYLTVDPSLGKIDKSTLSQQTLMELFVKDIDNADLICGSSDDPKDVSEWFGISLNDQKEIIQIDWSYKCIKGSIALEWLPPSVQELSIPSDISDHGWLVGTVNLTVLPESFKSLHLAGNYLRGTITLTLLPKEMVALNLMDNELSGSLDFTRLPSTLQKLNLSWNKFGGVCDFGHLPKSLRELNIEKTKLAGSIVESLSHMCTIEGSDVVIECIV